MEYQNHLNPDFIGDGSIDPKKLTHIPTSTKLLTYSKEKGSIGLVITSNGVIIDRLNCNINSFNPTDDRLEIVFTDYNDQDLNEFISKLFIGDKFIFYSSNEYDIVDSTYFKLITDKVPTLLFIGTLYNNKDYKYYPSNEIVLMFVPKQEDPESNKE